MITTYTPVNSKKASYNSNQRNIINVDLQSNIDELKLKVDYSELWLYYLIYYSRDIFICIDVIFCLVFVKNNIFWRNFLR